MLKHVLSIKGRTASADGITWTVDPAALAAASGPDLFEALFPPGPGRDWYDDLDPEAPLFVDADEALQDVRWELMCDEEDAIASSRGVAEVVEGSEAHTMLNLGLSFEMALSLDSAFGCLDEARLLFEEEGDREGELMALQCLGRCVSLQGDEDEAETYLDEALELAQELGNKHAEGHALNALGQVYAEGERWEEAEEAYGEALDLLREAGERYGEAGVLNNMGMLYTELERWIEARASYEQAVGIYEELGDGSATVPTTCNLASLWQSIGDSSAAIEAICRAMEAGLQSGSDGVLTATSHALEMGYQVAKQEDWDLLSRLAHALHEVVGPADEEPLDEEATQDATDMAVVRMMAQVALGLMFAVGQARGDQSHPAIEQTAEQVRQFDELCGDILGLSEWLDAACDRADGGLRLI